MKARIVSEAALSAWLAAPAPAVFQCMDLRCHTASISSHSLQGCSFFGCVLGTELAAIAASAHCLIVPPWPELPFNAFEPGLYKPLDLYDKFDPGDPENSYRHCLDWRIYESVIDPATRRPRPSDVDVHMYRRFHDSSISEALDELLDLPNRTRSVAIMGGHEATRDSAVYAAIARLALQLTGAGYLIITGGGPGLMEAANLGAYCAGFDAPGEKLQQALDCLAANRFANSAEWLCAAFRTWQAMGHPTDPARSTNIGIPTWFYGHEPPNVFATHIAKYFENSVREEGLLAVALAGVIFAEGSAGTVQEIFQDACQNYYGTYDKRSPMILFGADYWSSCKPALPLLCALAREKNFEDYLLMTSDPGGVLSFLRSHPPL